MTINCNGKLIDLSTPKVMGILNITPDSFFDGGRYKNEKQLLNQVNTMLTDGATFIDLGAYSSRPNAPFVSEDEESKRLLPVVKLLIKEFPNSIFSIDTFRSNIAKHAIEDGAAIINDISAGLQDKNMLKTIASLNVPYIMMHMRGTPQTMQNLTDYDAILKDILFYFSKRITEARKYGINDLIIDPGFGFSKTATQNFELLNELEGFKIANLPLLVGLSRKSIIYKTLKTSPAEALNGTTALNMLALNKGASILRVHDVKAAMECVKLYEQLATS